MPIAIVNDRAAARLRAGHVWVYRSDLLGFAGPEGAPAPAAAAAVTVRDRRDRGLGQADYSPHSQIALRLLAREAEAGLDAAFFEERLREAVAYRQRFVSGSEAYRRVWGEADGLPGLIVDRYGAALVVQTLTPAMEARQAAIVEWLRAWLRPELIVERNDARVRRLEGLALRAGVVAARAGAPAGTQDAIEPVYAVVNGLRFAFDLLQGQKTGGFLDQRENWAAAARYARPDHEALDLFTYHGGFALHLAQRGAHVEAVDSSRPALEWGERNAAQNGLAIDWTEANAFDLLRHYDESGRKFDLIVLDPPAFARNRAALAAATRGYKEINLRALRLLHRGGVLVTCCCSHALSEAALEEIVLAAAADAGRELVLLERRGQALDHPALPAISETAYLKCLIILAR